MPYILRAIKLILPTVSVCSQVLYGVDICGDTPTQLCSISEVQMQPSYKLNNMSRQFVFAND